MKNCVYLIWIVICSSFTIACGKYGPPLPPSAYAPKAVDGVVISLVGESLNVSWSMPSQDRRGKSLQSLDEIVLYTRLLPSPTAQVTTLDEFSEVQTFIVSGFEAKKDRTTTIAPGVVANDVPKTVTTTLGNLALKAPPINQPIQLILLPKNQDGELGEASNIYQVTRKADGSIETVSITTAKSPVS